VGVVGGDTDLEGQGIHIFGEAGFDEGAGGGGGRCAPFLGLE